MERKSTLHAVYRVPLPPVLLQFFLFTCQSVTLSCTLIFANHLKETYCEWNRGQQVSGWLIPSTVYILKHYVHMCTVIMYFNIHTALDISLRTIGTCTYATSTFYPSNSGARTLYMYVLSAPPSNLYVLLCIDIDTSTTRS
jgi:hypothetical protein